MDGIFLSRGNRGFPRKELRLDCAQAFHALHEKLTLARREVFFRSAEPPDKMDLHFILRLRAQNSARLGDGMFSITLICMGKLKEKFYIQASEEYKKRLGAFCDFTLLELPEVRLPENPNETQILQGLSKEAELIRAKVPKGSWLCIFAPEGKMLSSEELAGKLSELKKSGKSSVCFLIGSSFGVDAGLKRQADLLLSMSRMTFPHHLARVMALEQLYRAETIQAGTKYHK